MRQIALVGLAFCLATLLLSAKAADSSVDILLQKGARLISEPEAQDRQHLVPASLRRTE